MHIKYERNYVKVLSIGLLVLENVLVTSETITGILSIGLLVLENVLVTSETITGMIQNYIGMKSTFLPFNYVS